MLQMNTIVKLFVNVMYVERDAGSHSKGTDMNGKVRYKQDTLETTLWPVHGRETYTLEERSGRHPHKIKTETATHHPTHGGY